MRTATLLLATLLFAATAFSQNEPNPAQTASSEPSSTDKPFLGVNLESLRDYDRQFMFIDAMHTSRPFGTAQKPYDHSGVVGPDGWPTQDAGTLVMTEMQNINGIYRFYCIGQCQLSCPGTPDATVRNVNYNERSNRTTAEIVLHAPANKTITFALAFKNTNGGLRNIKLLRPGYDDESQIFTTDFLNAIKPFAAIRFMDYLRTNSSPVVHWSDRCKATDPQYTTDRGGPYEWPIYLANMTGKDIWLNIPAMADDDFIKQLAQLVRDKLKPNLHCYIEYSNEVWNGIFKQARENSEAAKREVTDGDFMLDDHGADQNQTYWAWKRVAKEDVRIKQLVGPDPRFRVILASHVSYQPPGFILKKQLEFIAKYFGPPNQYLYAVACAPYFGPGHDEQDPTHKKWYTDRDDITIDGICQRELAKTDAADNANVKAYHALAKQYGLKSFAYEGGIDLNQNGKNIDIKIASQYDPRTGQAVEDYLNRWYQGGGDGLFYFTLSCKYSKSGYWGLTEDVRNLATPKYQAAAKIAQRLAATQ